MEATTWVKDSRPYDLRTIRRCAHNDYLGASPIPYVSDDTAHGSSLVLGICTTAHQ
jgi:hypothetical protein